MKLDLDAVIRDIDGNHRKRIEQREVDGVPIVLANGAPDLECKGDLQLKHVLFAAVNATYRDETPGMEQVYWRGKTARKVRGGGTKNFSSEDVTVMLTLAEKRYCTDPYLVLSIAEILDPENDKVKDTSETALKDKAAS